MLIRGQIYRKYYTYLGRQEKSRPIGSTLTEMCILNVMVDARAARETGETDVFNNSSGMSMLQVQPSTLKAPNAMQ